jgi:hypothetical protein
VNVKVLPITAFASSLIITAINPRESLEQIAAKDFIKSTLKNQVDAIDKTGSA